MPKLPRNIKRRELINALKRDGWYTRPTKRGSKHTVLVKDGVDSILTIPRHRTIKVGTLRAIIRQSGLTVKEFLELCR